VNDWNYRYGENKVIFGRMGSNSVSGGGSIAGVSGTDPCPAVVLGGVENNISVSLGCYPGANQQPTTAGGNTIIHTCTVANVPIQKWVNLIISVYGRTLDIYIDGKLSRSCVLDGMYKVDEGNDPTLELGGPDGFGGYIGQTRVANFAYSPDQVYKHYLSGPFDNSMWALLMNQINPSQYSFNIQKDGKNVLSAST
jgi:hypothetical protein